MTCPSQAKAPAYTMCGSDVELTGTGKWLRSNFQCQTRRIQARLLMLGKTKPKQGKQSFSGRKQELNNCKPPIGHPNSKICFLSLLA